MLHQHRHIYCDFFSPTVQLCFTVPLLALLFQQQFRYLEMFLYWQLCCLNNSLSQLALLFSTAVQTFRDVSLLAAVLFKQQVVSGPFLTVLFQQQLRYLEMFHYWWQSCLNNRLSTVPLLTVDSMAVQIFRDVSLMAAVLLKQQVVHCPYPQFRYLEMFL